MSNPKLFLGLCFGGGVGILGPEDHVYRCGDLADDSRSVLGEGTMVGGSLDRILSAPVTHSLADAAAEKGVSDSGCAQKKKKKKKALEVFALPPTEALPAGIVYTAPPGCLCRPPSPLPPQAPKFASYGFPASNVVSANLLRAVTRESSTGTGKVKKRALESSDKEA
ncbi:hypothetical protein LX36DRAFT_674151 [Colletotrichum falcatum]|nr:hypothetical protein LX36DRAFT_674151 [Colletotrichum falcatum]